MALKLPVLWPDLLPDPTRRARMLAAFTLVFLCLLPAISALAHTLPPHTNKADLRHRNHTHAKTLPDIRVPMDTTSQYCKGEITWDKYSEYHIELLRLSVKLAAPDINITPVCMDYPTEARRVSLLLEDSQINTVFFGTTPEREELLLPAYVPLYLGTTGLRLFMLRPGIGTEFSLIKTLEDLHRYSMGQGLGWPDSEILINNGFNVILGRYKTLHRMLSAQRFDLYPRAYWQIAWEWEWMREQAPGITIHPGIALYYPQPIYFFVSPHYPELRDIIERGLIKAHSQGLILDLLKSHPETAPSFQQIPIQDIQILRMQNALLPKKSQDAMQKYGLVD